MKAEPDTPSQPQSGINKEALCRSLLEIVAYLDETQYTGNSPFIDRRAEVVQHSDPADPASADDTPQG